MKILYAIQATGNGHLTQATDLIPLLQQKATVDILVSGTEADIELAYPVKYRLKGLSFTFGKRGGIDILSTIRKLRLRRLLKDINSLRVEEYDLIINDFEPVSAWACRKRKIPCISLSHQSTLLNPKTPKPKNAGIIGKIVLKYYAPTKIKYGFHFENYDTNMFTPVIRQSIRESNCCNEGHYTVYLPAYSTERITQILSRFKQIKWQIFSKYTRKIIVQDNITIHPIDKAAFIQSIVSSEAVLCGAGFETPAEALYLKKKLLVIPMTGQYEQQCNAAALHKMGVSIINTLSRKSIPAIQDWINSKVNVTVNYPDIRGEIVETIIAKYSTIKHLYL